MAEVIEQTSGIKPRFYMLDMPDEAASKAAGRPISRSIEYCDITFVGNPIKTVLPKPVDDTIRDRWPDEYRAWKTGVEPEEAGTSLADWPGCSRQQAEEMMHRGIKTVEQLATVPDGVAGQFAMGRTLQRKAVAYLEAANDSGKVSEQLSALQAQTSVLAESLKQKDDQIAQLSAAVKARDEQLATLMQQVQDVLPKRRGRPPKDKSGE